MGNKSDLGVETGMDRGRKELCGVIPLFCVGCAGCGSQCSYVGCPERADGHGSKESMYYSYIDGGQTQITFIAQCKLYPSALTKDKLNESTLVSLPEQGISCLQQSLSLQQNLTYIQNSNQAILTYLLLSFLCIRYQSICPVWLFRTKPKSFPSFRKTLTIMYPVP